MKYLRINVMYRQGQFLSVPLNRTLNLIGIGVLILCLSMLTGRSWSQCNSNNICANAINIPSGLATHDCVCPGVAGAESWFIADIGTSTQNLHLSMSDGSQNIRFEYEVYGPFVGSVSCASAIPANLHASGTNYSNFVSSTSIGYSLASGVNINLTVGSGTGSTFYIVKMIDVEANNCVDLTTRLSPFIVPIAVTSVTTHSATVVSSVPNTDCGAATTACDFGFQHNCSGADLSGSFLWYELDVQNVGAVVDINVNDLGISGVANFSYILMSNVVTNPCGTVTSSSFIDQQTGVTSFSQTFSVVGQYYLVLYDLPACPEVIIDQTPDCGASNPCPVYSGSFKCDSALVICDDISDTNDCPTPALMDYWYNFDVTTLPQVINVNTTNGSGSPQNFDWKIIGPLPTSYTCDDPGLSPYTVLVQTGISAGSYSLPATGEYFLVVTTTLSDPIINIDFDVDCGVVPCPEIGIRSCAGLQGKNLIINGDFGFGNYGFTTDYTDFSGTPTNFAGDAYKIGTYFGNQEFTNDHTPNNLMMSVAGVSTAGDNIWCQTVSVLPNTDYEFSMWALSAESDYLGMGVTELQLYINGSPVGPIFSPTNLNSTWIDQMVRTWNSGSASTANICIVNQHNFSGPRDIFAIDDIAFVQTSGNDCCINQSLDFFVESEPGAPPISSITWNFGDGSPTSSTGTHSYTTPGTYTVTVTVVFADGCMSVASEVIEVIDCCPTIQIDPCPASATNLVFNGDFELGNQPESVTGIVSDYDYDSNTSANPGEGEYILDNTPIGAISPTFTNHTPGTGSTGYVMFVHDDLANPDDIAWEQSISTLTPNTDYLFEAWFTPTANLGIPGTDNINLFVNGTLVGSVNRVGLTPGTWYRVHGLWNSGSNTVGLFQIQLENNGIADDGRVLLDDIAVMQHDCNLCANQPISLGITTAGDLTGATVVWDFGDGSPTSSTGSHTYTNPGIYTATLTVTFADGCVATTSQPLDIIDCEPLPCESCIGSFAPIPGGRYLIGAWAMEDGASPTKTSYTFPEIYLEFQLSATAGGGIVTTGPFTPQGFIIDGWQRIENEFVVPADAISMKILLRSTSGDVYYDDVRVFPFDASMKCYTYDPVNMRLSAELDERHYATFYDYDEEGKLTRIRKETEKGVMTIQSTINNSSK